MARGDIDMTQRGKKPRSLSYKLALALVLFLRLFTKKKKTLLKVEAELEQEKTARKKAERALAKAMAEQKKRRNTMAAEGSDPKPAAQAPVVQKPMLSRGMKLFLAGCWMLLILLLVVFGGAWAVSKFSDANKTKEIVTLKADLAKAQKDLQECKEKKVATSPRPIPSAPLKKEAEVVVTKKGHNELFLTNKSKQPVKVEFMFKDKSYTRILGVGETSEPIKTKNKSFRVMLDGKTIRFTFEKKDVIRYEIAG